MRALFVAYQDVDTRSWTPVGQLTRDAGYYRFVYTKGAERPEFRTFGRMDDIKARYVSEKIFPLFSNRLLPKSRPEYAEYLRWMGLTVAEHNELEELARTGGQRATDSLELIPYPEPTLDNRYEVFFFCRGLRHLPEYAQKRTLQLQAGERLYLLKDVQNNYDRFALMLRTDDPVITIGHVPKYYTEDFSKLMDLLGDTNNVQVTVERVNPEAPTRYRLLCKLSAPWPEDFLPCSSEEFTSLYAEK